MNLFKYILLALILALPINVFGGTFAFQTDVISTKDLSAYYDLRDRSSLIQVTNLDDNNATCRIHVQIFQHDRGCSELNFFDTLTPNDTVVYDLDNLVKNNGNPVPVNLQEDSYGYVVVTGKIDDGCQELIGNFRIIDNAGYEYRTNMDGTNGRDVDHNLYANFNTVNGANQADIVGYSWFRDEVDFGFVALNNDFGFDADIFIYDLAEEPLSCDRRNFACGNVMNYGVNEDYPNSKGGPLLCPGGGLADPKGGYVLFDNRMFPFPPEFDVPGDPVKHGFIGINNGNGTGSMDIWHTRYD